MVTSKPKAAYTSDQRRLSILIAASSRGGTTYHVTWGECSAGEEKVRERVLVRGRWKATLNEPWQAVAALVWLVERLKAHLERPKS